MAAVRQWVRELGTQEPGERELRGSVTAVPVLNLPAFRSRTPFVTPDDGKNLNRCFPGNPSGTFTDRLADAAFRQLIVGADALIDVHAGDMVEALEPFALYDAGPAEAAALEMAAAYGLGYVIRQEPGPDRAVGGTSSAAAASLGIPAIIAEAGGCGLVERTAVQTHVRGLNGVLTALGMAGDPPPAAPGRGPTYLRRFLWLRCTDEGWWEPAVRPGETVAEGQLLGTVSTLDGGRVIQAITAPAPGVPMFVTSSPAVAADGLLLGLGAE
jgi:predicted deacylase